MRSLEGDGRGIPAPEAAAGAGLGSFASDGRGSLSWNPRLGVLVALVSECGGPFPLQVCVGSSLCILTQVDLS